MAEMMYGYACEYCKGTVRPRLVAREVFKHKLGFVLLENVVIGICDECGNRYYSADILHTVHEIATGKRKPERIESIPVVHFEPQGLMPAA
jgi:YgiT-type zinc finger domain-containing protein